MMIIVPEQGMNVKALQTKYPIIAWEIFQLKARSIERSSELVIILRSYLEMSLEEIIMNGDAPAVALTSDEGPIPPKTKEQKLARKNELKAKSTSLLAILDEHLLKFHGIKDAKTLWEAIKTSQLEIQGKVISQEDANLKLLRSLPSAWNNIALIMRNKADLDGLSMDDLYNNLKVYEAEIKSQSSLSSNSQNVAFVSSDETSSTNEVVNTALDVPAARSKGQASSSTYADDVMFSFFVNQSNSPQLDNEDLEQINTDDLEEMDLKWQVAMLTIRVKIFLKKTGRNLNFSGKETVGFDRTKVECYNCHKRLETPANALVVQDGIGSSSSLSSDSEVRDSSITELKNQLAKALKEKDDLKLKLEKFEPSSMKLTKLINSQISVNNKSGVGFDSRMNENELHDCHLNKREVFESAFDSSVNEIKEENNQVNDRFKKVEGYHAVPPPYTGNYMPSRPDLSFAGLDDSIYKTNVSETITSVPRNESTTSKSSKDSLEQLKGVRPCAHIIEEQAESLRKSQSPRVDKRNWNGIMTQKLGNAVATKSGLVPVNAAKQSSPRAATSISTARHVNTVALKQKVNNVTTAGPEVVVSTAEGKRENVVKSSACWIWRPTGKVIDHISKDSGSYMPKRFDYGNPQYALQDQGIFDSGCSRHMTGNKSYLIDYQDIDGGFVAFTGSPKGGKITGKGKIRTGKLDFEDVYFVKELKFNLFSVSQMCDKKNSVLFTETECLVLSPDFKLLDESQVLLKVPRQNNMYSFDLKNVVPSGGLTCLIAKATIDESNLWHRRLGHINFKTINKLIRRNLVRGLPSKLFENDHSCVACQKGKTLIKAARTMVADSLLPTTFWAEAVNTTCYVQNRVLVTKPHNKTPYELLHGRLPSISFMGPFGCLVTILNTLDPLGKFDGKADEGFLVRYSINSKAFRIFNTRTRKVEENLHITFLENKPNVARSGIETNVNARQAGQEKASDHEYILLPLMLSNSPLSLSSQRP
ncbi:ribonuclease H-like domain-containing protein [Tanacetum coccineum]